MKGADHQSGISDKNGGFKLMNELARIIIDTRKRNKLSQQGMAELAGISKHDVIALESGLFVRLDDEALRRIAYACGEDSRLFIAIYRSDFQSDLRKKHPATQPSTELELSNLGKSIKALPKEKRTAVIQSISLLLQALTAEPA